MDQDVNVSEQLDLARAAQVAGSRSDLAVVDSALTAGHSRRQTVSVHRCVQFAVGQK